MIFGANFITEYMLYSFLFRFPYFLSIIYRAICTTYYNDFFCYQFFKENLSMKPAKD